LSSDGKIITPITPDDNILGVIGVILYDRYDSKNPTIQANGGKD
jgi:hypothetical protein